MPLKSESRNHEATMEDLPLEIIGEIAGKSGDTCWRLWFLLPRFSQIFCARKYRGVFVVRTDYEKKIEIRMFGKLQSIDDEPSVISRETGFLIIQWHDRGCVHRGGDLPAQIDVTRKSAKWCHRNQLHRDGGPASISTDNVSWWRHGNCHRDDNMPAISDYHNNTNTWKHMWCNGGEVKHDTYHANNASCGLCQTPGLNEDAIRWSYMASIIAKTASLLYDV